MSGAQVHYELSTRTSSGAGWSLDLATEDRKLAVSTAEDLMKTGKVIAAKVTKETMDPETREFQTISILNLGAGDPVKAKKVAENLEPLCITPQDLYTAHARDRISRLLEAWLDREGATTFELLHRADLVEALESSGTELQHAIQKVAIPEAQARGRSVHELMRSFQSLVERSIERLLKDARKGVMPDIAKVGFPAAAEMVSRDPERAYLLGCSVANSIAEGRNWDEKINQLLTLADNAPIAGPPRALALGVIEQPLSEMLGSRGGIDVVVGVDLDLGGRLAAMTWLVASAPIEALMKIEASVARAMPPLTATAKRLAGWLGTEDFQAVRVSIAKQVLRELTGPRRLRPTDPRGEIEVIRALAMALTTAAGNLVPLDDIQDAFTTRSRMLVTADFIEGYLKGCGSSREEAETLVWLIENVIGAANKRQAARFLSGTVSALKFENELRNSPESPTAKLRQLALLQKALARAGLAAEDYQPIQGKLGEIGGLVEAESKIVAQLGRATGAPLDRLVVLLQMAVGDNAPLGPAAERAKSEALRLVRQDDIKSELAKAPDRMGQVRAMIQQLSAVAA